MNVTTKAILALALAAAAWTPSRAATDIDILLTIDDSNPSAVTFTATGLDPFRNDSAHTFFDGIDLLDFFTSDVIGQSIDDAASSTLSTSIDGMPAYGSAIPDNFTGTYMDLDLYNDTPIVQDSTENFLKTSPAFIGSVTFDLSDSSLFLPGAGTRGPIFAGYSGDLNSGEDPSNVGYLTYLGLYEVVPEPAQWSLLLVGFAALVAVGRLRARSV